VSDAVVILAKSRVRIAERLERLSQPTNPSLEIQVLGDPHAFAARLEQAGLKPKVEPQGALTIEGPHAELAARLWQVAHQAGVGIRSIEPSKNSLEEIFLAAVKEQPDAHS
jgi:hypothetical protein